MSASTELQNSAENACSKADAAKFLRIGIAGAGLMGKWHAHAAKNSGGKIVAIADTNQAQAQNLAAKYPSADSFGDVLTMIERQTIDVIHVCTPLKSHYKIAELALRNGINVFIEKPLVQTTEETIRLYDLAAKNNVRLCPVHQFVFQRSVAKARNRLTQIGRIVHLQATVCSAGGAQRPDWELDEINADILPHPLSLFPNFLGTALVRERFSTFRPQAGELRSQGSSGEISLEIFISLNSRPAINTFRILGTKGSINLNLFHDFAFFENGNVSKFRKMIQPFDSSVRTFSAALLNLAGRGIQFEPAYPGLQNLVKCFYQALRENTPSPISADQTINIAQVRDYLIRQAKGGKND